MCLFILLKYNELHRIQKPEWFLFQGFIVNFIIDK